MSEVSPEAIVNAIIGELHNRRFFRWTFDGMEPDVKRDLIQDLVNAVKHAENKEAYNWLEVEEGEDDNE